MSALEQGGGPPPGMDPGAWWRFRGPRCWSNRELRRFAPLFTGRVANVSGWRDEDKEGGRYRDYFSAASAYALTNHDDGPRGFQGAPGELKLDLSAALPASCAGMADVAFCHTVLEHVFDFRRAFANLCLLSTDVVIAVVPYIQELHHGEGYGDYWRFTPFAMRALYGENGLGLRYLSANGADPGSVYLFCLGYRQPRWDELVPQRFDVYIDPEQGATPGNVIGSRSVRQG